MSAGSFLKQRVRVTGLSARPDLNGQEGMCVAFEADRYSVAVNSDLTLRVKPANLELCQPAPPSIPKKRGSDAVDLTADSESEMSSPSSSSEEEVSEFEDTDDSDVGASKKKACVR
jgi:hypothetical protein